jgi:hypothetical protein
MKVILHNFVSERLLPKLSVSRQQLVLRHFIACHTSDKLQRVN